MNHPSKSSVVFIASILLAVILFLFFLSVRTGTPMAAILRTPPISFVHTAHNFVPAPTIRTFNFLWAVYLVWGVLTLILAIRRRGLEDQPTSRLYPAAISAGIIVFGSMTALNLISQIDDFRYSYSVFAQKSLPEKQKYLFKDAYLFPRFITDTFPGRYRAELITDMDMTRDPGMFTHRAWAYFLYPIDIRGIRKPEPIDALIIFPKDNPEASVGDEFTQVISCGESCLVAFKGKQPCPSSPY